MNKNLKRIALLFFCSTLMLTACNKPKSKTITRLTPEEEKVKIEETKAKKPTKKEVKNQAEEAYKKAKEYARSEKLSEGKIYDKLIAPDKDNFSEEAAMKALLKLDEDGTVNWVENAKYQIEKIKERNPDISEDDLLKELTEKDGKYFTEIEAREAMDILGEDELHKNGACNHPGCILRRQRENEAKEKTTEQDEPAISNDKKDEEEPVDSNNEEENKEDNSNEG